MTDERARPPKGWLYGVLLTILIVWVSGVFWEGFRDHEIPPVSFVGGIVVIIALALRAHQALTNDGYGAAKWTIVSQRVLMPLGIILYIIGRHL